VTLSATISPTATVGAPLHLSVRVYSPSGELVAVLFSQLGIMSAPTSVSVLNGAFLPDEGDTGRLMIDGPGVPIIWSGMSQGGQLVESGSYFVLTEIEDSFGKVESWTTPLAVIRTQETVDVEIYNSAGELVWTRQVPASSSPTGLQLSSENFALEQGGLTVIYGNGPSDHVSWDGSTPQGRSAAAGSYLVKLTQRGADGSKQTFTKAVSLLSAPDNVFSSLLLGPNPALSSSGSLEIRLVGALPSTSVSGGVYNLAGELISGVSGSGGALSWEIPKGISGGIYILRLSARDASGRVRSQAVKFSLLR
jgi:hypothetical protein